MHGRNGEVKQTEATLGDITAQVDGQVNLDSGYDLNINVLPFQLARNVTAKGTVTTNLRQAFTSKETIDVTQMPLAFDFQADLPTEQLVSPYYQLPQQVAVGNLQAQGKVDGTVAQPQGLVKWELANIDATNIEEIAGSGELVIDNQDLYLQNSEITYGDGKVDVVADANLDNKQWQASLDGNSLNLRPFAKEFSNANLNLDHPLKVDTVVANFNGSLDELDLEKIQGNAELNLDVNGGDAVVDSKLNSGKIQGTTVTNNINLNPFIASLPVAASLQAGTIKTSGKIKQLLAFKENPSLNSLKAAPAKLI